MAVDEPEPVADAPLQGPDGVERAAGVRALVVAVDDQCCRRVRRPAHVVVRADRIGQARRAARREPLPDGVPGSAVPAVAFDVLGEGGLTVGLTVPGLRVGSLGGSGSDTGAASAVGCGGALGAGLAGGVGLDGAVGLADGLSAVFATGLSAVLLGGGWAVASSFTNGGDST